MRNPTGILALLMLITAPVAAQQPAPDSARTAAAAELVEVLKLEYSQVPDMTGAMSGFTGNSPATIEMAKMVTEFYQEFMPWDTVKPRIVRIYADMYTESELRELTAFYRTPIGQKLIDKTPEIGKAMMQMSQELLLPHMTELQQRMMARIRGGGD